MAIESPKSNIYNQDTQFNIFELTDAVQKINDKYPYAKVNPASVTGDAKQGFFVGKDTFEEYAEQQDRLNSPSDDDKWYDK